MESFQKNYLVSWRVRTVLSHPKDGLTLQRASCIVGIPEAVRQDLPEMGTSLLDGTEGPSRKAPVVEVCLSPRLPAVLSTCCSSTTPALATVPSGQAWRCHPACSSSSLGDYSGNHPSAPLCPRLTSHVSKSASPESQVTAGSPPTSHP